MNRSFKITENPKTLEEAMENEAEKERLTKAVERAGEEAREPEFVAALDKANRRKDAAKAKYNAEIKDIAKDFIAETKHL